MGNGKGAPHMGFGGAACKATTRSMAVHRDGVVVVVRRNHCTFLTKYCCAYSLQRRIYFVEDGYRVIFMYADYPSQTLACQSLVHVLEPQQDQKYSLTFFVLLSIYVICWLPHTQSLLLATAFCQEAAL